MIDKKTLQSAVLKHLSEKAIRQEDLAKQVGVSQSVVSRAINGRWMRYSRALRRVGEYVQVRPAIIDPRESKLLMDALGHLWDGSPEQERRLVDFLLSVGELSVKS